MALTLVITNAGRAALVAAAHDGTNAVRIAQIGVSPTAIVAAPTTAALPGEVKRIGTISGGAVADDTIHVMVRDETSDVYSTRSIALYLQDGTLFAAYGQPGVIAEKSAQAMLLLAIDVRFADIDADTITFGDTNFLNPPATVTTPGVVELATLAEANAGTDDQRAVTPKGLMQAILAKLASWGSDIWRASNDGAGSGLDADLLDGQQAAAFSLLSGQNVFTAVNTFRGDNEVVRLRGVHPYIQGYSEDLATPWGFIQFNGKTTNVAAATGGSAVLLVGSSNNQIFVNAAGSSVVGPLNVTGPLTQAGNQLWHVGNDGSGSGLDADLLDGRQGSEFALLSGGTFTGGIGALFIATSAPGVGNVAIVPGSANSVGYVSFRSGSNSQTAYIGSGAFAAPLEYFCTAGHYFIGPIYREANVVWDASNDGAGSGMDADLLDGRQGSEFALLNGAAFTGTVSAPVFAIDGANTRFFKPTSTIADLAFDAFDVFRYDQANNQYLWFIDGSAQAALDTSGLSAGNINATGTIRQAGNQVWHVGNDGAGSGMDADLLDGWERDSIRDWGNLLNKPGSFPPTGHTHGAADIAGAFGGSLAPTGYVLLPNGLIFQWGNLRANYTTETTILASFPIAFPNACLTAQATGMINAASNQRDLWPQIVGAPSTLGMTIQLQSDDDSDHFLHGVNWFAIGY